MPTKPFDRYTMSPTQEPEPLLCAAATCRIEAPRFYEGGLCRSCYRNWVQYGESEAAILALEELDEEKHEHLEQYASMIEERGKQAQFDVTYRRIARELRLINAGVSPDDIRHGTYPNLEEFEQDDYS